jgi:hypothetical protein
MWASASVWLSVGANRAPPQVRRRMAYLQLTCYRVLPWRVSEASTFREMTMCSNNFPRPNT